KEKQYGAAVERISFRHKKYGWKRYSVEFLFKNSTEYLMPFGKDPYMRLFLSNISLRPSCHNCRFNKLDRPSNITIGDAWGINNIHPELDDDKGTSVVLVRGEKGKELFDAIKDDLIYLEDDVDKLLPPNSGGRKSVKPHYKRKKFFKEIDNQDVTDLIELLKIPLYRKVITKFKAIIRKCVR
ncbi:MAG: Coenzyme F420 hydrogenase/dehydrogenase, beta subunit C-terminal domain, partial [Candidatus Gastranaerophilaceae bacterium]